MLDVSGGVDVDQGALAISDSDVYINNEYSISYNNLSDIGDSMLSLSLYEQNYNQQINLDRKVKNISFLKSINLSRGSRFFLEVEYSNTAFKNLTPIRTDDNVRYRIQYSYAARRNVSVNLELIAVNQKSSHFDNDYEDSRAMLSLSYTSR